MSDMARLRPFRITRTYVVWETPANLRERAYAQRIECQAVVSGRWKPLSDPYWDDCVIEVKWRWIERAEGSVT